MVGIIIITQIFFFFSSFYLVKEHATNAISQLEIVMMEDTFDSLQDKDFVNYETAITESLTDNSGEIKGMYLQKYKEILEISLKNNASANGFSGTYYTIDPDSISLELESVEDGLVVVSSTINVKMHAGIPFGNGTNGDGIFVYDAIITNDAKFSYYEWLTGSGDYGELLPDVTYPDQNITSETSEPSTTMEQEGV